MLISPTEKVNQMEIKEIDDNHEEEQDEDAEHGQEQEPAEIEKRTVQPWKKQITVRGIVSSVFIGSIFSVILMKLSLTNGIHPNLNVAAALVAFIVIRTWSKILGKFGISSLPFTQQENTMIQTCTVACYSITQGGGFGTYLVALDKKTYELTGVDTPGNPPDSYKQPGFGWMTGYLFLASFIGLFVLIPLRKILIVDHKLIFPSGLATAVVINGFHGGKEKTAKMQVSGFTKFFSASFFWAFFKWFFSGKDELCGFSKFPTFGLQALKQTFYFDFSLAYVGTGMIVPHNVNLSMLFGSVISWGLTWPLIKMEKGKWFPADIPETNMKSLDGYKVFIPIALLLGDGLYSFIKVTSITLTSLCCSYFNDNKLRSEKKEQEVVMEDLRINELFAREIIPMWIVVCGYTLFAIVTAVVIPFIFPEVKWYYVVVAYILTPPVAFCNAYGAGLTDINLSTNYAKIGLFIMAAIAGKQHGLVAGLIGCGLIKSVVTASCVLMIDFKTAHLTLTSAKAMLVSQAIGTAIGCIIAPMSFFLFYMTFDIGNPNGEYKVPYAIIYRNLALLGVEGPSALPKHCLHLCYGFFAFGVIGNIVRDVCPSRISKWMPLPIAMALPFLIGSYVAIDMCVGSFVVFVWQKWKPKKAGFMVPAVASGLICGEGLWAIPDCLLALGKIKPPICMNFVVSK